MAFEIFISYSTSDLESVDALRDLLKNSDIRIFVAEYTVKPSESLSSTIEAAIRRCDLFMVLWSRNAKNSDWVMQEIGQAKALNKKILPLVLEENLEPPGFIKGLKYLRLDKGSEEALKKAQDLVMAEYKIKKDADQVAQRKKTDGKAVAVLCVGALLLWVLNQK